MFSNSTAFPKKKKKFITLTFKNKIKSLIYNQLFKNQQAFYSFPCGNKAPICKKLGNRQAYPCGDAPGTHHFGSFKCSCH